MEDPTQGPTATPGIAQLGHGHSLQNKGKENHIDLYNSHTSISTFYIKDMRKQILWGYLRSQP